MDHFTYIDGALHAEGVALSRIAEAVGTPTYVYSTATLVHHYRTFAEAFAGQDVTICFAVKANSNQAVLTTLARQGAGADVLSEGELRRALAAGIPGHKIVISGVGKTRAEIALALESGISQINVESVAEMELISEVATEKGASAPIAVRVNPDVDAKTHEKITTGRKENKFGIDLSLAPDVYARAAGMPGLHAVGVAVHIGSQLTDLMPFRDAFSLVAELVERLRSQGHDIRRLDLGGGLGIPYRAEDPPPPTAYAAMVKDTTGHLGVEVVLEPGRMIAGNAGILLTRVLYVKEGTAKNFVVVDAGMNDLMRPALYDAWHGIVPVAEPPAGAEMAAVDVVGPVCETADIFGHDRVLPMLKCDDLLAIRSAGAYGAVMASTYNSRPLVAEVLVRDDAFAVIRPRQSLAELLGADRIPDWLGT
ncbi:MAG: diaminopimelate decarboxylase [Alphaproteobacteria bacterium]|nr:diaminopimelate decarboxylase [Alphaproteobacteria bacterium]